MLFIGALATQAREMNENVTDHLVRSSLDIAIAQQYQVNRPVSRSPEASITGTSANGR